MTNTGSSGLSPQLLRFISSCVPTIDALEILMSFLLHPGQRYSARELSARLGSRLPPDSVEQYLRFLSEHRIVDALPNDEYTSGGPPPETGEAILELCKAYNERPVTLIQTVYHIADSRNILSFADAFRIRKEPS